MPTIYLAGPDIFHPDAHAVGARKKALCAQYGFKGLYPLDQDLPSGLMPADLALAIYRADVAMMDRADAIIANLTPFRSPSADPGTVFELAWMLARGRPAFGYSTDHRTLRERVAAVVPDARQDPATNRWTEPDGTEIEDFGLSENLMIDRALHDAGTPLVTPPPGAVPDPMACFERCLLAARARMAP